MVKNMTRVVETVALSLALATPLSAQTQAAVDVAALQARLDSTFQAIYKTGNFPGATAAVVLPDGTSLALAVGYSDSTRRVPMRSDDRMLQGSVGKTYYAAAAMQLVAEGRLDLDAAVSDYLGDRSWFDRVPNASNITVRNLMNHTSGVMRYEFKQEFLVDLKADPDKRWEPEELVAYILDEQPQFAAGQGWEYSDTNYILLGLIIESITGRRLYDEVENRLLEPLGLNNTVPSDGRVIPGLVQGYAGAGNPFLGNDEVLLPDGRFVINPQFEWAGGGYASTTEDLARWAKAVYEGRAFEPELLAEVLDGVPARLGPGSAYGLGVIVHETPLGTTYGHSGFFPGYLTEMRYYPKQEIAVAVQVNTSVPASLGRPLGAIAGELASVVIEQPTPQR
jgi:D-alanyl-D-alanine carboxypeptidase